MNPVELESANAWTRFIGQGIDWRRYQLTIDAFNSYGSSSLFGLAFNAQRLICLNGMMLDFLLGSFRFRHFGQNDFQRETEEASGAILRLEPNLELWRRSFSM